MHLVRSAVIADFDELVRELGGNAESLYRQAGLSGRLLDDGDRMITCESVCSLLDTAATELNFPTLGLALGRRRKIYQLGLLWPLISRSPNLREALSAGANHLHLHNSGLSWRLEAEAGHASLIRTDRVASDIPTFQWAVYSTCSVVGMLRTLCGINWRPRSVSFIHPQPNDTGPYDAFFGVKVIFNADFNAVTFPEHELERPGKNYNKKLLDQLAQQVEQLEAVYSQQVDFPAKIRLLMERHMHVPDCSQECLAKLMEVHPKALQRQLRANGITFRELKSKVRIEMAERYLQDSEIPLTAIANILGFSELSCFSHAFKSHRGLGPAEWRTKHRRSCTTL